MSETVMAGSQRRWKLAVTVTVVAGFVFAIGWQWWDVQNYRRAMAEIDRDIDSGRHGMAAQKLAAILAWKPGSPDAAYLLGKCEKGRGRIEAACAAWGRVPPQSPFAFLAIEDRIQVQIDRGALSEVEKIIEAVLEDPRLDRLELPTAFRSVYLAEGRVEEAQQLIEARWNRLDQRGNGASEQAVNLVREYIALRTKRSVEATRELLNEAARLAPGDDRVWLGKANLATRMGSYDEAERWLDACMRGNHGDAAVWRSRLNWAMAAGRVRDAREASKHLTAERFSPSEVQKVAAWLAARRGDVAAERHALERLIATDPNDFTALTRLAELDMKDGQPERTADLRGKQAEIERLNALYQKLYERYQPERDAVELARLARALGRQFEARAFLTVAVTADRNRVDLKNDLAELDRDCRAINETGRTVVELFDTEIDSEIAPNSVD